MNLRKRRKSSRIVKGSKTPLGYLKIGFKDCELAIPFGRCDSVKVYHFGNDKLLVSVHSGDKTVFTSAFEYNGDF